MKLHDWRSIPLEQMNPTFARKVIHGTDMTVANLNLLKGGEVPWHSHLNEQLSIVLTGSLRFEFEGGHHFTVNAGQVMEIVPHLPHRVFVLEDSSVLDVFSPVREDWRSGNDSYLREKSK